MPAIRPTPFHADHTIRIEATVSDPASAGPDGWVAIVSEGGVEALRAYGANPIAALREATDMQRKAANAGGR